MKLAPKKFTWLLPLILFFTVIYSVGFFRCRVDLTAEKRFSLSKSSIAVLENCQEPVKIQVFLTGDLPADYKKLSLSVKDMLEELQLYSHNQISFKFVKPDEGITEDSVKYQLYDSLARLGVVFEQAQTTQQQAGKQTIQQIIPSALVTINNKMPIAIDLRSSRKIYKQFNVINEIPAEDIEATRNAAEALLEFKFINAIDKLTRQYVPTVAYVTGNGEPIDLKVNDLGQSLRNDYKLGVFNLKAAYPDATKIDALLIVKPTIPFTDSDKLKLDQYVMNGGKIIWCIDKLHAELDSLMRTKGEYTAFDRNLNIDELLFKYGVRINGDLLQDLLCSKIPLVVGRNPDGSPKMQRMPWPYYPLLSANNNNPISRNLDKVLPVFPSSIDTVAAKGIKKTILLSTDTNSRSLSTPALVSVNSVKSAEDFNSFTKSFVPVAVLLEGNFQSLYAHRIGIAEKDSVLAQSGKPYLASAAVPGKQIVMSDADIVTNAVSATTGPLEMGVLPFENYRFANREFFLNSIDYLVSKNAVFESRNKDFKLRLLNKELVATERNKWQLINVLLPVLLMVLVGIFFNWQRKQKYCK